MPRPTNCIFCGGGPLSKEHVMGEWLTPVVATPPPGQKLYIDTERMEQHQERRFPQEIDIQVRCVCEPCNNGWMSKMESEVKPIIEALQDTSKRPLNQDDQFLLSKWATKTAIIARYYGSNHEVPSLYREWFYKNQKVPPNTFVWVGTYGGALAASMQTRDMSFPDLDDQTLGFPLSQFVIFTAGRLLMCVLTTYLRNKIQVVNRSLMRERLRVIAPYSTDIIWPIPSVDDAERLAISDYDWDGELIIELRPDDSRLPQ